MQVTMSTTNHNAYDVLLVLYIMMVAPPLVIDETLYFIKLSTDLVSTHKEP
jgi:hypothetical protein